MLRAAHCIQPWHGANDYFALQKIEYLFFPLEEGFEEKSTDIVFRKKEQKDLTKYVHRSKTGPFQKIELHIASSEPQ